MHTPVSSVASNLQCTHKAEHDAHRRLVK